MLRDAIVEVLHGLGGPDWDQQAASVGAGGHVADVTVDGDHVGVELVLPSGWPPASFELIAEVARRLQPVAEVSRFEIALHWPRPPTERDQ